MNKKLFLVLFAVVLLTCKKTTPVPTPPPAPEVETPFSQELLLGTWDMESMYVCDKFLDLEQQTKYGGPGSIQIDVSATPSGHIEFSKDNSFKSESLMEIRWNGVLLLSRLTKNFCAKSKFAIGKDTLKNGDVTFTTPTLKFDNSACSASDSLRSFTRYPKIDQNGKRLFLYDTVSSTQFKKTKDVDLQNIFTAAMKDQCGESRQLRYVGFTYRKRE